VEGELRTGTGEQLLTGAGAVELKAEGRVLDAATTLSAAHLHLRGTPLPGQPGVVFVLRNTRNKKGRRGQHCQHPTGETSQAGRGNGHAKPHGA
jgi:hypothetical protein